MKLIVLTAIVALSSSPVPATTDVHDHDHGVASTEPAPDAAPAPSIARATFDRFAALEGTWGGESTAGWKDECSYQVIARGSVVMQVSEFEAHPGETMVTMFYMDGEHLGLTHYCVAGNQPRLRATAFSDDGNQVTFTYVGGTGLDSRDQGHMDQAVITFDGEGSDSLRSKWTWYENGAESWMEEIHLERRDS